MSEILVQKFLDGSLDLPLVLSSGRDMAIALRVYRYFQRQIELLSPEIIQYCDKEVIDKLLWEGKDCISVALDECLKETVLFLKEKKKDFRLGVYLFKSRDSPDWKGFTILINVNFETFKEKLALWNELEQRITEKFSELENQFPEYLDQIQEANKLIATSIQNL